MAVPPAGRHTYKTYHQKLEEYRLGDPGAKLRSNAELNMVAAERLSNKISDWEKKADEFMQKQQVNPFSGYGGDAHRPKYDKNDENYGRPVEGTMSAVRGKKAATHISREVYELCLVIAHLGKKQPDETFVITFGSLFEAYTNISNKVVGMLMRARKHKLLTFETEMLYQRRDEAVLITLFGIPEEKDVVV